MNILTYTLFVTTVIISVYGLRLARKMRKLREELVSRRAMEWNTAEITLGLYLMLTEYGKSNPDIRGIIYPVLNDPVGMPIDAIRFKAPIIHLQRAKIEDKPHIVLWVGSDSILLKELLFVEYTTEQPLKPYEECLFDLLKGLN